MKSMSFHWQHWLLTGVSLLLLSCGEPVISIDTVTDSGNEAITTTQPGANNPGYRRINTTNPEDPLAAEIFELDNGLRVYLTENHEEPRFYAEIAVRAGSKHDPADATGLAHYLEHLLFKGSRNLGTLDYEAEKPHLDRIVALYEDHFQETDPVRRTEIYAEINREAQQAATYAVPNEIDKVYNGMGGSRLNAHTWHEETVYKVGLPANRLRQWAEIESDRFIDPVFRLFHTELETVYEEKNRTLDNAGRIIGTAVDELLYKVHPYGQQPTIGTVEHLKNPSLVYIQNFFDTWYVPNNMGIFISGDIDIDSTIELIAEKFGHWQSSSLPEPDTWSEPPLNGAERRTVRYPGQEQVQIAFRTAANNSSDKEALILLDMILDNRTAGLINLNLNQQQKVAEAGSSPLFLNDYGSQSLYGVPKQDQTPQEVEALLLEQLEIIKAGEFDEWIIAAIVNDFLKNEKASLEYNAARVAMMRQSFIEGTEWDYHIGEIDRMQQLGKQDVVAVANRYFGDNFVSVYRINEQHEVPKVEKPQIDPVVIDPTRQSEFAARILAMEVEEIEPAFVQPQRDYRKVEFAPGVDLYYAPNPLNDLFSFSIGVEVGTETIRSLGLASSLINVAGTESLSNEELQKAWYRMGTEFRFGAGENSSAFSINGLDTHFEDSLSLMLELIKTPSSDEQTLDELKSIVLKTREDRKSSPPAIAQALYLYNRYREQSPLLEAPTSMEIMQASAADLLIQPAELLDYNHTLAYTGSLPLEQLVQILRRHHEIDTDLKDTTEFRYRRVRPVDESEVMVVDQQTAQAQVRIEFADGLFQPEDSVMASLYTNYFGSGMSSVVFQELREARALAYSASARYMQGSRLEAENLMLGAIGTQTDKTAEALATFIDLIDNMPASTDRFDETVNALVNRYRTSKLNFREVLGAVRNWERLGLEGDPRRQRFTELQQVSLDDLQTFQQTHIKDRAKLISVVGDLSIIDTAELEQFGSVQQVQVNQLFVE
ncbi:MAG: insulinase family protein [Gammaproteobacteria bacterium]|nr:insulinase family protein [Gammaproteobacteria bacterium]